MKEGNEGMTISSQSLLLLGERLITLDLDIYSNKSEWDE
jgi:hypothetical protein